LTEVTETVRVSNLTGQQIAPFQASGQKIVVFVFVTVDCPISNRYAPEVQRLSREFGPDAAFWLVYPDANLSTEVLQRHVKDFGYSLPALDDRKHRLVQLTGATVMPEVVVFDRSRRLVYRGRIDNRFVTFGTMRAEPSERDLQTVLAALQAGKGISPSTTQAIGCSIPD
jgi:hypothetical protein